jgi:hypothetical protein
VLSNIASCGSSVPRLPVSHRKEEPQVRSTWPTHAVALHLPALATLLALDQVCERPHHELADELRRRVVLIGALPQHPMRTASTCECSAAVQSRAIVHRRLVASDHQDREAA